MLSYVIQLIFAYGDNSAFYLLSQCDHAAKMLAYIGMCCL